MKKINTIKSFAIFLILIFLIGCSKHPPFSEMTSNEIYTYSREQYDKENYFEASEGLSLFTLNYSGNALVDSAQFLLGQSHYHQKEYLLAADAFDELTRRFPSSPLVPEAMYMYGTSYWKLSPKYALDQDFTIKTIEALQAFIDYYPERADKVKEAQDIIQTCRDKLAHKKYANGMIYKKMKDYNAASIYFKAVIDLYYDTEWAAKATFQLAESFSKSKKRTEAIETYRTFLQKYSNHPWSEKAKTGIQSLVENKEK